MHDPAGAFNMIVNIIGVVILPVVVYFGNKFDKRFQSIDTHMQTLLTKVAVHDEAIEVLERNIESPRSWQVERDFIKDKIKSLEVRTR